MPSRNRALKAKTPALMVHTLGEVLGLGELGQAIDPENPESSQEKRAASELYAAMDWLLERQAKVENILAKRHLGNGCTVLYDLSSSYFEGRSCPLAQYGHSRDHRKDRPQVQYGLLCSEDGIPVAVEVVEGNNGDPKTIPAQVEKLKARFGLERVMVVGDWGMVTAARIQEDVSTVGYDWITALIHKSISPLVEAKVITPSLFDERGLAEIDHPDYPGERLIACYNPIMAEEQARKREELLILTEKGLQKVADACERAKKPLEGVTAIGLKTGAALARFKMARFSASGCTMAA
jgi:transposase